MSFDVDIAGRQGTTKWCSSRPLYSRAPGVRSQSCRYAAPEHRTPRPASVLQNLSGSAARAAPPRPKVPRGFPWVGLLSAANRHAAVRECSAWPASPSISRGLAPRGSLGRSRTRLQSDTCSSQTQASLQAGREVQAGTLVLPQRNRPPVNRQGEMRHGGWHPATNTAAIEATAMIDEPFCIPRSLRQGQAAPLTSASTCRYQRRQETANARFSKGLPQASWRRTPDSAVTRADRGSAHRAPRASQRQHRRLTRPQVGIRRGLN